MRNETEFRKEAVLRAAQEMAIAARTAPKARGLDLLEIIILEGSDIEKLSGKMREIGEKETHQTFIRDSESIMRAQAVVVIGTKIKTIGLKYCSFCGYDNCTACEAAKAMCAYNPGDLGIAVGSAVAVAADYRIDNRIMYTVGKAAIEVKFFSNEVKLAFGIPLSVSSKNPFFDRR